MAIKIPFVAEVSAFLRGSADVVRELGKVSDSLDDISVAGSDVDTQVGRDLDRLADTADDSADRIKRSFQETFDTLEREGRTSSRKVQDHVDDVGRHGSTSLREFGDEAKQNVAETLSSFDGSASSAVDTLQGTFGGLVAALGPAGLIGSGVIAAGIGIGRKLFSKSQENAEAFRTRVQEIFDELRENAGTVTVDFKSDGLAELLNDSNRLKGIFGTSDAKAIHDALLGIGLSPLETKTLFEGITGGMDDVRTALALVQLKQAEWADQLKDPSASLAQQAHAREQIEALAGIETALIQNGEASDGAAARADLYSAALGKLPTDVHTDVTVTDNGTVAHTQEQIDNIKASKVPVPVGPDMTGFNSSVQKYLNSQRYYITVQARPGKNVPV